MAMARSFRENEAVGMFCSKSDDVADNVRWRARIEEAEWRKSELELSHVTGFLPERFQS